MNVTPRPDPSDALIEVDRDDTQVSLSLYDPTSQQYALYRSYDCAVGRDEYRTPTGRFRIESRSYQPSWTIPTSDWAKEAGLTPGEVIPYGDPRNPIQGRWLGFCLGAGFHGTLDLASLGHPASHGCVRMRVEDVEEMFPHVRIGTVVIVRGRQPSI